MSLLDQACECPSCHGSIAAQDAPTRRGKSLEVVSISYIHCDFCGVLWEWKRLADGSIDAHDFDDLKSPIEFGRAMRRMERARRAA